MDFKKTNLAVLKSIFSHMDDVVFIRNVKILKAEYLELKPNFYNQNYERKLWDLYKFSAVLCQSKK